MKSRVIIIWGIYCEKALFSPETGILSSHEFMEALVLDGEFDVAFGSRVVNIENLSLSSGSNFSNHNSSGFRVTVAVDGQDNLETVDCKILVNCAGLFAHELLKKSLNLKSQNFQKR